MHRNRFNLLLYIIFGPKFIDTLHLSLPDWLSFLICYHRKENIIIIIALNEEEKIAPPSPCHFSMKLSWNLFFPSLVIGPGLVRSRVRSPSSKEDHMNTGWLLIITRKTGLIIIKKNTRLTSIYCFQPHIIIEQAYSHQPLLLIAVSSHVSPSFPWCYRQIV